VASIFSFFILCAFLIIFMKDAYGNLLFAFRLKIKSVVAELLLYPWIALIPLCLLLSIVVVVVPAMDRFRSKIPGQSAKE
jgi:hypothetical protein